MPVRDGERFLRGAIESLQKQTLRDFELIVVDDGSRDATPAILAEAAQDDARTTSPLQHAVLPASASAQKVKLRKAIGEPRQRLNVVISGDTENADPGPRERFDAAIQGAEGLEDAVLLLHDVAREHERIDALSKGFGDGALESRPGAEVAR